MEAQAVAQLDGATPPTLLSADDALVRLARYKQAAESRRRARHTPAERRMALRQEAARQAEFALLVPGHWLLRTKQAAPPFDPARSLVHPWPPPPPRPRLGPVFEGRRE